MRDRQTLVNVLQGGARASSSWEHFHENSKLSRHEPEIDRLAVREHTRALAPALQYRGYPSVALPEPGPCPADLLEVLRRRESAAGLTPQPLALRTLSGILRYTYGPLRDSPADQPASGRSSPSAGGSYPLELYVHSVRVAGLDGGLYHYDPLDQRLTLLRPGDHSPALSKLFVQPELVLNASVVVFMSAVFERSLFKYGDRGYRLVLLEAGHVAQTLALLAEAARLKSVQLSAYYDRELDAFLDFDGLAQSVLYVTALGSAPEVR